MSNSTEIIKAAADFLDQVAISYRTHAKLSEYPDEMFAYEGSAEMAEEHAAALRAALSPEDEGSQRK